MELDELLNQHKENYRNSLIELINNNTNVLVDQDIVSVFKKPPLDSMDFLRTKFLDLAKKNKMVFNTEELDQLLEQYRSNLLGCCDEIRKVRISELCAKVREVRLVDSDIIKINKKDFILVNKHIKKVLKDKMSEGYQFCILNNIDLLFMQSIEYSIKNKIIDDLSKFMKSYQKQLLENCELKIMVKDTTLMNGVKEQGDRYLFTLEHSHLLNDLDA